MAAPIIIDAILDPLGVAYRHVATPERV